MNWQLFIERLIFALEARTVSGSGEEMNWQLFIERLIFALEALLIEPK